MGLTGMNERQAGPRSRAKALKLKKLERVKGIEPSYSAWKSENSQAFSTAILTFFSFSTP
jgi:hypothetical protein